MLRKRFRRSNSTDNYQAVANMPLKLEEVTILKKQVQNLHQWFTNVKQHEQKISEPEIWDIFAKLVEALNLYHQKGIVYGNLKMLQIWITGAFHVTLDESQPVPIEFHKSDQKQWVIGMKDFFAPELMTYEGDIIKKLWRQTMQSDMFALGCVIYKLIGSIHPFNNGKRNTVWLPFIITKEPDQLPEDYSNQLKDIVMSLLRKAPKQRPSIQDILGQPQIAERVQGWKQMKAIEMESIRMQSFKFKGQMNECTIIPYKDKDLIQRELFEIKADGTINESSSLNSQYQIARQMHKEFRLPGICRHGLDKSTVLCFVQIYYKEKKEDSEEFRKKFKEQLKEFGQKSAFYVRSGGSRENGQDHAVQYDFYLFMTQQEKYSTKTKKEREEFKDSIQPLIKSCSGELINFVGMKLTEYVRNVVYNCDLVKNETRQKACNLDYQFPVFGKDVRKIIQKRKKVGKKLNFVIRKEEDDLEGNMKKDIEKGQDLPNMVKKKRKRDDEVNENKDLELNEQENKDIELNEQDNREEEDKELDVKEDMNQDEQKEVSEEEEEENQDKELKEKKVVCSKCKLDITKLKHGQCCWCKLWFHFRCQNIVKFHAKRLVQWWCITCKSTEYNKKFTKIIDFTKKNALSREKQLSELFESSQKYQEQNNKMIKDQEQKEIMEKDQDVEMEEVDNKEEENKEKEENQDKELKEKKVVCSKCEIDVTEGGHGQCCWCKLWFHFSCQKDHKSKAKKYLHWWCIACKDTKYHKKYINIIFTTLLQPLQREKLLSELFESRNQDKGESQLMIKDLELNEQENKEIELNEQDNREEEDQELDVKEDMNQDEQKEVSEEEEEENQDKELKEKKVVCSKCKLDITEGDHGQCCWCKLWFHFHCLHFKKSRANKLLLWWCNTCKSTEFHKQFKSIICATIKRPILREQKFSELFESRKEEEQQNIMKLKDQEDVNMLVVEKNYLEMNEHNNNEENKDRKLNVLKGQEGATIEQKNQKENIEDMNMQNGDKNKELEVKKDMNQDGKKEEEIKQQEENQDKDLKEKKVVCNKCEIDITAYDHGQCYWCKLWTHYKCSKDHKSYAKKQLHWWCITCKSTEYNKKYKKIINTTLQQPLQREKQLSELFESRNQDKGESKLKIKDQQQNNSMETDKDIELKKQDNIEEENKELDLKENQIKNKKVKENKEEEENQDKDLKKKKVVCSQCEIDITEGDHGQCCWCKQWFHFYCQDIWKVSAQILLHWWCNTCRGTEYHKQYKSIISTTQLKPLLREKQLSGLFQSSQKDQKEEVQEDENKELEVKEDMNQDGKKEEEIKQEEENQDKDLKEKKVVCSKCEIDITAHDHGQCYWCKLWFHFRCQKDFKYFANKQLHWWCITCKSTEFNKKYKKIIEKTKIKPLLRDKQLSELFESRKKDQEQNSMIIKEKEENNNEEQNKQEEEYEVDEEINKENEKKEEENKQQEYEMMEVENKQSNVF